MIGVRVSITDQLVSTMQRRGIVPPKDLPDDIVEIEIDKDLQPAIIGLRTVLEIVKTDKGTLHQWHVTVTPDSDVVRRRFLAKTGTMMMSDGATGSASRQVNYSIVEALQDAHRQISDLGAPEPHNGTTIQIWYGYKIDGEEFFRVTASSLSGIERERNRIDYENARNRHRARVYVPFTRWVLWQGAYQVEQMPDLPQADEWRVFHKEALSLLFARSFKPCMRSLWKAGFADGVHASKLRASGFPLEQIGKTVVSEHGLRELIQAQNQAANRTFFYIAEENAHPDVKG